MFATKNLSLFGCSVLGYSWARLCKNINVNAQNTSKLPNHTNILTSQHSNKNRDFWKIPNHKRRNTEIHDVSQQQCAVLVTRPFPPSVSNLCRVRKGTGSQVDVILNKEVRAYSHSIGVCEAVVEASRCCIPGAHSAPILSVLWGMYTEDFRYCYVRMHKTSSATSAVIKNAGPTRRKLVTFYCPESRI